MIKLIRTDTTLDLSQKAEKNGQHLGSPENELSQARARVECGFSARYCSHPQEHNTTQNARRKAEQTEENRGFLGREAGHCEQQPTRKIYDVPTTLCAAARRDPQVGEGLSNRHDVFPS